jgi:hypothetical protein
MRKVRGETSARVGIWLGEVAMRVFRELFIRGEPDRLAATLAEIERTLSEDWFRDKETERQLASLPTAVRSSCFGCFDDGRDRPGATVILTAKDADMLHVANVIPHSRSRLDYNQYNRVLEEFYNRFVQPAAAKTGVVAEMTDTQADLERWLSPAAAEKLRRFSSCANKGTGASLAQDRERWNDFVLSAYQDQSTLDASTLRRWLVEVADWPPEVADQLAIEYEYGRELLAFADGHRRSA